MKDSQGNRKLGPGDDRVGWGWGSNHADYLPLMASAPNAAQLLHEECAGAPLFAGLQEEGMTNVCLT